MTDNNEVVKLAEELANAKIQEFIKDKKQYRSNYYQQNKDKEREQHRNWVIQNKDYYLQKRKDDYKNRVIKCEACNEDIAKYYFKQHERTKKHQNNLKIN